MCSSALNSRGKPAVSPMSGGPTFDIEKKNKGEFKTPPRPTGRRSNHVMLLNLALCDVVDEIPTTSVMFWPSNFFESAEHCNKLTF